MLSGAKPFCRLLYRLYTSVYLLQRQDVRMQQQAEDVPFLFSPLNWISAGQRSAIPSGDANTVCGAREYSGAMCWRRVRVWRSSIPSAASARVGVTPVALLLGRPEPHPFRRQVRATSRQAGVVSLSRQGSLPGPGGHAEAGRGREVVVGKRVIAAPCGCAEWRRVSVVG